MSTDTVAIILAAGEGKRLRSRYVKAVHKVGGLPIVSHVHRAATAAGAERSIVVVGRDAELVREILGPTCEFVEQRERLGTGHACQQAESHLADFTGTVLVLMGDAPLITPETLSQMLTEHTEQRALATVLTARPEDTRGLGRIVRDQRGLFQRIVEERDATEAEKLIAEINAGFYCFEARQLFSALARIDNRNNQGEYMLTDVLPLLAALGPVHTVELADYTEALGINDRKWLSEAERAMQERTKARLMMDGVTFIDPASTHVDCEVTIGQDTIIFPFTTMQGNTVVGDECQIGPGSTLINAKVEQGCSIIHSVVLDASIGAGCQVGPFAHIRPETVLAEKVKIGNFVELKKAAVGTGTKISHLSYVGDALIGTNVNIGAGTILVNYDGQLKHTTTIEDDSFVGCNSNLIAPVKVGKGAYVAAGSTITTDVPSQALGIARARQENKEGWVARKTRSRHN